MAQPNGADQFITLNPVFLLRANSELAFAKRLGWARTGQVARAQISLDGGTWQDLWSQSGTESAGELTFSRVTNSLSSHAGKFAQIRFAYDHLSGAYYTQTSLGYGFYVDDISVSNTDELIDQTTRNVGAGTSFYFVPTNNSDHVLAVRALLPGRTLNWGPSFRVSASSLPPVIQVVSGPTFSADEIHVDFTATNYRSGMTFQLWKAFDPAGPWSLDTSAVISTITPNMAFRATAQTGGAVSVFYRVKGSY